MRPSSAAMPSNASNQRYFSTASSSQQRAISPLNFDSNIIRKDTRAQAPPPPARPRTAAAGGGIGARSASNNARRGGVGSQQPPVVGMRASSSNARQSALGRAVISSNTKSSGGAINTTSHHISRSYHHTDGSLNVNTAAAASRRNGTHHGAADGGGEDYVPYFQVPTCGLAAHQHSPHYKMLLWALEAGADLLPPSDALEQRSSVLERPLSTEAINSFGAVCEKNSEALQQIYMSHLCVNCDENAAPRKRRGGGGAGGLRSTLGANDGNDDEGGGVDPHAPRFLLLAAAGGNGGGFSSSLAMTRNYNAFQRQRVREAKRRHKQSVRDEAWRERQQRKEAVRRHSEWQKKQKQAAAAPRPSRDDRDGDDAEEDVASIASSSKAYPFSIGDMSTELTSSDSGEEEVGADEDGQSTHIHLSLRQHRELIRASEIALLRLNRYVEQGPGYLLPLYRHYVPQTSTAVPSVGGGGRGRPQSANGRGGVGNPPMHTRASLLRSAAAALTASGSYLMSTGGGSSAYPYPVASHTHHHQNAATSLNDSIINPLASAGTASSSAFSGSSASPTSLSVFAALDGTYQMPSYASLHAAKKDALAFRHANKVMRQLQRLELGGGGADASAEEDGAAGEGDDEEDGGGDGGDADGPLLEVRYNTETGTLSVKFRLSEAQLINVRSQISVPKVVNAETGKEEEGELALSSSTFLFATEFIGIGPDLWLGAKGPWRGKVLHVARRRLGPDGTSTLVEPPYLATLGKLLDERGAGRPGTASSAPAACATAASGPTVIDSILVGPWCFARLEPRSGGRPSDPYACLGCGNTRQCANIAYAAPDCASGMRRGRYYCPYCRRSMAHVNVLLATDPSAGVRQAQWNGGPKLGGRAQ